MITLPPYQYDAKLVRKSIPLVPNHAMPANIDMGDPLDSAGMVLSTPATRVAAMPALTTLPEPKQKDKQGMMKYIALGAIGVVVIFVMYRFLKKR